MDAPAPTAPLGTRCLQCGYLVERLRATTPCPECGLTIAESLKPTVLELLPPSRITGFMWGTGLCALISLGSLIVALLALVTALAWQATYSGITVFPYGTETTYITQISGSITTTISYFYYMDWLIAFLLAVPLRPGDTSVWRRWTVLGLMCGYFGINLVREYLGPFVEIIYVLQFLCWLSMLILSLAWTMRLALTARWKPASWLGPVSIICVILTTGWSLGHSMRWLSSWRVAAPALGSAIVLALEVPRVLLTFGAWRALRPIVARRDAAAAPASNAA